MVSVILSRVHMELEGRGCSGWLRQAADGWNRAAGTVPDRRAVLGLAGAEYRGSLWQFRLGLS